MNKKENLDIVLFLLWPIFCSIASFVLNLGNFGSIILFLGVPSFYLTIRAKSHVVKSLLFSLPTSVIGMVIIDYIAQKSGSWEMFPNSIFPCDILPALKCGASCEV